MRYAHEVGEKYKPTIKVQNNEMNKDSKENTNNKQ